MGAGGGIHIAGVEVFEGLRRGANEELVQEVRVAFVAMRVG